MFEKSKKVPTLTISSGPVQVSAEGRERFWLALNGLHMCVAVELVYSVYKTVKSV
jgi:hypothetical protein